jgi:hypothetical protein
LTFAGSVEQLRLSDDAQKVAYTRRPAIDQPVELRVVNRDGTGDTLLMGPTDFDALYPLGEAIHHDVYQFDFLPGSHILLFNTRSIFEGPGLAKHDDLIRIDTDSLTRTMLLAPGKGGDFTASPDGRFLALVRPGSAGTIVVPGVIEIANPDGTPTGSGVIHYTPVITYSEYAYYAQPVWKPDSSMIGVAIPSPDPLAPATSGETWTMAVGGAPSSLGTISGGFFFLGMANAPLLSPTLDRVTFTRPTATTNVWTLHVADPSGAGETVVATGQFHWQGWSPDGAHFVFGLDAPMNLQLAQASGASGPLGSGTDLRWFNTAEVLYLSGSMGAWTLQRGGIGLPASPLASPAGDFVQFDFVYR